MTEQRVLRFCAYIAYHLSLSLSQHQRPRTKASSTLLLKTFLRGTFRAWIKYRYIVPRLCMLLPSIVGPAEKLARDREAVKEVYTVNLQ